MTRTSNLSKVDNSSKNNILIYVGIALAIVWPVIIGATNLQVNLPCAISPNSCTDGRSIAQIILFLPFIIGGFALSAGILSKIKMNQGLKSFLTFVSAIVMYIISYWTLIFVTIAVNGLGS